MTRVVMSLLNFRPGKIGGTETYLRSLLRYMVPNQDKFFVKVVQASDLTLSDEIDPNHIIDCRYSTAQLTRSRIMEAMTPFCHRGITNLLRAEKADLYFFPQQSIFPKRLSRPSIMTVHDIQHHLHPERISVFERLFRAGIYTDSLKKADKIISISEFTRQTLVEYYEVPEQKIVVVPHGFDPVISEDVFEAPYPHSPYYYYPAASHPHKNHLALVNLVSQLKKSGQLQAKIIFTGMQTSYWQTIRQEILAHNLQQHILHEGYVSRQRVRQLFQHADLVLFPSLFEGFGIPILEANAHGKKVVTSDLPVFEEIGVPAEQRIDFNDVDQFLQAAKAPYQPLTKKPLTWKEVADRHLEVFQEFLDSPN